MNDEGAPLEPRPAFLQVTAGATSGAAATVSAAALFEVAAQVTSKADAIVSVGQALGVIAQDPELLQRSADLARQVKGGTLPPEEAARQISQYSPEVASLLDGIPAAARKVLLWVLLFALQIIAAQALAELRDHSATPADVERVVRQHDRDLQREIEVAVERALREYESQHPPAAEPPRATKPPTKDGR